MSERRLLLKTAPPDRPQMAGATTGVCIQTARLKGRSRGRSFNHLDLNLTVLLQVKKDCYVGITLLDCALVR